VTGCADFIGDIRDPLTDITAAREAIGCEVAVRFEEGLRRTVEWYRQQYAEVVAR